MILNVKNLSKVHIQGTETIRALSDVSFTLDNCKSIALVGPSGSGKTTVLSLLAGLDQPTSGSVEILGTEISKLNEKQLAEFRSKHIGIVFQQFHLMAHLTALENVSLPLEIQGLTDVQIRALKMLEAVGLSNRKDHLPHQMSGGERQRVAIARACVLNPQIILADEPSGSLDTETGLVIMDLLFSIAQKEGSSLILVTHDLQLAERCDQQIHLKGGQLIHHETLKSEHAEN